MAGQKQPCVAIPCGSHTRSTPPLIPLANPPTASNVDTVINVKGAEAAHERNSGHLWEGERRIIVRLMFPHPIDDMQEFAHRRHSHDFERFAAACAHPSAAQRPHTGTGYAASPCAHDDRSWVCHARCD